jgi:hypothetical protein
MIIHISFSIVEYLKVKHFNEQLQLHNEHKLIIHLFFLFIMGIGHILIIKLILIENYLELISMCKFFFEIEINFIFIAEEHLLIMLKFMIQFSLQIFLKTPSNRIIFQIIMWIQSYQKPITQQLFLDRYQAHQ